MTEKRYFERRWGDEYYIFDSQTISEKEFDEKVEYEDYQAFADSMAGDDVVNRLNKLDNEKKNLKQENEQLKEQNQRLSEQKHIYKQDWKHLCIDKELLDSENEQLKQRCKELRNDLIDHSALIDMLETVKALDIGDMIWNTMGYKTQTEFSDDFAHYREKAKRKWRE